MAKRSGEDADIGRAAAAPPAADAEVGRAAPGEAAEVPEADGPPAQRRRLEAEPALGAPELAPGALVELFGLKASRARACASGGQRVR